MPQVIFYPTPKSAQKALQIQAETGDNLIEIALKNDIEIEHMRNVFACTTCHVIVRGFWFTDRVG